MPDLSDNHAALAYLFYRLDDGPNAIAEARTALSLDPNNADAYQYLGLGLYSNYQYRAAVHAYAESLGRDPNNADTYYDMGIALHADGNMPGAIVAYQRAIRLRPEFWEAHSNLGLILHEQGNLDQAVTEYREAKRIAPSGSFRPEQSWQHVLRSGQLPPGNRGVAVAVQQASGVAAGTCLPGQRLHGAEELRRRGRAIAPGTAPESDGIDRAPHSRPSPDARQQTGRRFA